MSKKSPSNSRPMTQKDASRIQSVTAIKNGGQVPKGSFSARASRAAAQNAQESK